MLIIIHKFRKVEAAYIVENQLIQSKLMIAMSKHNYLTERREIKGP